MIFFPITTAKISSCAYYLLYHVSVHDIYIINTMLAYVFHAVIFCAPNPNSPSVEDQFPVFRQAGPV